MPKDDYHLDLIAVAREVHGKLGARAAGSFSINHDAGTISDRESGELYAYLSPAFTALTAEQYLGWHPWPQKIPIR